MGGTVKDTWGLQGSRIRDRWRFLHKQRLGVGYYGSDGDFFIIGLGPDRVIAYLDVKGPDDELTATESVLYAWFYARELPVFIVTVFDVEVGSMRIERMSRHGQFYLEALISNWREYGNWEIETRAIEEAA
jgi:hypothetical protein